MAHAKTGSRHTRSSRAVLLLLAIAFATTVAASVVSWVAVDASRAFHTGGPAAAMMARRVAWLQQATLGLIASSVLLTATALIVYFRRAVPLSPWVTVCAWTRRVEWQGRWISFEEFLAQRFDLRCTHGICDEEAEKLRRTERTAVPARSRG